MVGSIAEGVPSFISVLRTTSHSERKAGSALEGYFPPDDSSAASDDPA